MSIGIGLHCWYCEHGPCNGECDIQRERDLREAIQRNIRIAQAKQDAKLVIIKTLNLIEQKLGLTRSEILDVIRKMYF